MESTYLKTTYATSRTTLYSEKQDLIGVSCNIILIVLDTVRAGQLGIYGRKQEPMPNLASLATNATVFRHGFSNAPWTLPAHASLFTGKLPSEHGCHGADPGFSSEEVTLAEQMSADGFHTYGISNNIWISDHFGFDRGFETFYKQWQLFRESQDIGHVLKNPDISYRDFFEKLTSGNPFVNFLNGVYGKYLYRRGDFGGKRTTDDALSIAKQESEPLFLFVNYMEAHAPYMHHDTSEQYLPRGIDDISRYSDLSSRSLDYHTGRIDISPSEFEVIEALYDGELRYLDRQLGRLFKGLRERDLFDESLIIVVGDHGENIGDHGLMAHRFSVHDTLLRVPLIVNFPETVDAPDAVSEVTDLCGVYDALVTDPVDPEAWRTDEPAVVEYLDTNYTPEFRDEEFTFTGSRYDRRYAAVVDKRYKYVTDDGSTAILYEYNGDQCPDDFERAGRRVTNESVEDRLKKHIRVGWTDTVTKHNQEFDNGVKNHLEELGYL